MGALVSAMMNAPTTRAAEMSLARATSGGGGQSRGDGQSKPDGTRWENFWGEVNRYNPFTQDGTSITGPGGQTIVGATKGPGAVQNDTRHSTPLTSSIWTNNQDQIDRSINALKSGLDMSLFGLGRQRDAATFSNFLKNQGFARSEQAYRNQLQSQLAEAGLDIRAADIPLENFPQWYNFLEQKKWNEVGRYSANLEYNGQQQVNSANQRLLEWRDLQNKRGQVEQQTNVANRQAMSDATVSGIVQNAKQPLRDIRAERQWALRGLTNQDQQSKLSETQRRQQISNNRKNLMADFAGYTIDANETKAKLKEREQLLGIEAQKARLKPQQLMDAMNVTLANLGLDKTMSTGQFLESLGNMDAQTYQAISQYVVNVEQVNNQTQTWQTTVPKIPMLGWG